MKYNQREIVLIPFPYTDLTRIKRRPVLIVSNNEFNNSHADLIVVAITSNLFIDKYSVEFDDADLEYSLLPEKSVIKVSKIFTANKNNVIKKFSILNQNKFNEVIERIYNLIKNIDN